MKKPTAEFIGTFTLVFFGCGAAVIAELASADLGRSLGADQVRYIITAKLLPLGLIAGPGAPAAPPTAWAGDLPISLLALATSGTQVRARLKDSDGAELYVTGVRYKNSSLKVRLTAQAVEPSEAGSWYDVSAIDEFDTTS